MPKPNDNKPLNQNADNAGNNQMPSSPPIGHNKAIPTILNTVADTEVT